MFIGYDSNVDPVVLANAQALFLKVHFVKSETFEVTNATGMATALSDAELVYLCPSTSPMILTALSIQLLDEFVLSGGVLLYPAGFNDTRSHEVAVWLQDPLLQVNSTTFGFDIDQIYNGSPRYPLSNLNPYDNPLVALPTNQSLKTAFGRITPEHQFGLPFQWFSDTLYWVKDNTHHMILTPDNRQYCMFQRDGLYSYYESLPTNRKRDDIFGTLDEACWVFNFPHGDGRVVEISMSFRTADVMSLQFTERFIGVVAAAVGLTERAQEKFVSKPNDVLLKYKPEPVTGGMGGRDVSGPNLLNDLYARSLPSGPAPVGNGGFGNVAYDLSLTNNVFVWRKTNRLNELKRLRALTGAESFVMLDMKLPPISSNRFQPGATLPYYAEMITKGDNLVRQRNCV